VPRSSSFMIVGFAVFKGMPQNKKYKKGGMRRHPS